MYDFQAMLAPLTEHTTDNLTYLSRHTPVAIAIHAVLGREFVY